MQDTWYGDHRDLVKWGTLVHLARSEKIQKIIQVAFLRHAEPPPLETDRGKVKIPKAVWKHFRDVERIRGLHETTKLKITIFDLDIYHHDFVPRERKQYVQKVTQFLRSQAHTKVVLLDPDTGIEPGRATAKHVKVAEIQKIWGALSTGDWLVVYQHKSRVDDWLEKPRAKFAQACGTQDVRTFQASKIASDVAFFAAKKE